MSEVDEWSVRLMDAREGIAASPDCNSNIAILHKFIKKFAQSFLCTFEGFFNFSRPAILSNHLNRN